VAGKFELLDRIFPKFQATGHRVLIFFQMTQVMDIMEDYMRFKGIQYLRLDGSTKAEDRTSLLEMFNAPDSPYFAFLLSTRAGGLGLNLQTADTVIIYDTDWNPHQDLQAQDRAHRIGQTKEVRILRLITEDSVEEAILERAHSKLEIDGKVIQAGKFDQKSTSEEQEAFLRTLLEAEEVRKEQKDEDDEMDDEELNEILARSAEEQELFKEIDDERNATSMYGKGRDFDRLFSADELPEEYSRDISEHLEPQKDIYLGRGARERKIVYYDDGLTEEQWLAAVDNDEVSIEDAMRRKRERLERRAEKVRLRIEGTTASEDDVSTPALSKRKRQSASLTNGTATPLSADISDDEASEIPRKRSRGRPPKGTDALSQEDRAILAKQAKELVDAAMSVTDEETGRKLTDIFAVLPSKSMYPDYYMVIKDPMALDIIQKKIRAGRYRSINDVKADFDLMWSNAKTYNEAGSFVYNDAETLSAVVDDRYRVLTGTTNENDRPRLKLKLGFKS
jgi:ATP-dependent helicase STH1/SNF2